MKKSLFILTLTALLTACGGESKTATTAEKSDVKARQDLMQELYMSSEMMQGMLENPNAFDAATFAEQAKLMQSNSGKLWGLFTDPNAKGDATDAVWTNTADFTAKAQAFDTALANLITTSSNAKNADDVNSAFGAVGESCGSCHKAYKK